MLQYELNSVLVCACIGELIKAYSVGIKAICRISGSLIWSKTPMELIFNPCGEFRLHISCYVDNWLRAGFFMDWFTGLRASSWSACHTRGMCLGLHTRSYGRLPLDCWKINPVTIFHTADSFLYLTWTGWWTMKLDGDDHSVGSNHSSRTVVLSPSCLRPTANSISKCSSSSITTILLQINVLHPESYSASCRRDGSGGLKNNFRLRLTSFSFNFIWLLMQSNRHTTSVERTDLDKGHWMVMCPSSTQQLASWSQHGCERSPLTMQGS